MGVDGSPDIPAKLARVFAEAFNLPLLCTQAYTPCRTLKNREREVINVPNPRQQETCQN